jgi:transposase
VSIYIPSPEIRALREVCRERDQMVRLRTRLAQMIRALLLRHDAGEPPEADRQLRRLERLFRASMPTRPPPSSTSRAARPPIRSPSRWIA